MTRTMPPVLAFGSLAQRTRRSVANVGLRWRLFRSRHPYAGTGGLIGANVLVWGAYNVAPEAPRRITLWDRWAGGSASRSSSSTSSLKTMLPTKDFWERHFFASWDAAVRLGRYETVPLCTFMHVDGQHLLFNMISLFFFGRQLEYVMGFGRYLTFYLMSGTAAASAQVASLRHGRERFIPVCGASGGVYALMAFTTCIVPRQTVYLYMVLPVPLWALMAGLVAADVFVLRPNEGHVGHLTGAACGATMYLVRYARWR